MSEKVVAPLVFCWLIARVVWKWCWTEIPYLTAGCAWTMAAASSQELIAPSMGWACISAGVICACAAALMIWIGVKRNEGGIRDT